MSYTAKEIQMVQYATKLQDYCEKENTPAKGCFFMISLPINQVTVTYQVHYRR